MSYGYDILNEMYSKQICVYFYYKDTDHKTNLPFLKHPVPYFQEFSVPYFIVRHCTWCVVINHLFQKIQRKSSTLYFLKTACKNKILRSGYYYHKLLQRSWSGFFAALRLRLRASKSVRPVLFDVMSSYGLWNEEIM